MMVTQNALRRFQRAGLLHLGSYVTPRRRRPRGRWFRGSMPGLPVPLSPLRDCPASARAFLGVGLARYAFTVRLFHSQHLAGLTRPTEDLPWTSTR
jgi:hypothetical protein